MLRSTAVILSPDRPAPVIPIRRLTQRDLLVPLIFIICLICGSPLRAQVATGTPRFGSFSGGPDIVNNGNLNVHITIPVVNKAGRGMPFYYYVSYDTSVWSPKTSSGASAWTPVYNWGWRGQTEMATGYVSDTSVSHYCYYQVCSPHGCNQAVGSVEIVQSNFVYHDQWGVPHAFPGENDIWSGNGQGGCTVGTTSYDVGAHATDGSGLTWNGQNWSVTTSTGQVFHPPTQGPTGSSTVTDPNGNKISESDSSGIATFTDTLGTTVLTVSGSATPSSPLPFTYTDFAGQSAGFTVNYVAYTVATNFGAGIPEFGKTNVPLVSEIDLPDISVNPKDKYTFLYEATPSTPSSGACTPLSGTYTANCVTARLASITLPTGGVIKYTYTGGSNGILSDGTVPTLKREVNDQNGNDVTWTYTRTENGTAWKTVVSGPMSATYYFQQVTSSGVVSAYETERQIGVLDLVTCYNNSPSPCNGNSDSTAITLPITRRTVMTTLDSKTFEVDTTYDSTGYGIPQEVDEYDWGASTPTRKTLITYDYNTSCGVTNPNVSARPCNVTVKNGSGVTAASVSYNYDANGNMLSASSGGLTTNYTYNSTGTVNVATDPNGTTTTYTYGQCNSGLPTQAQVKGGSLSFTSSADWNCNGAVPTDTSDWNTRKTSFIGYDAFWRLSGTPAVTFPDNGSLGIAYPSTTEVDTTTNGIGTNNSLTRTDVTKLDGLGRVTSRTVAGVETDYTYDALGRLATVGINGSGAKDTYSYDALNRVTGVTHADSNPVGVSYTANCAVVTDEAKNQREVCTDGLGRVTSVCEVNSLSGSGACGQAVPETGYLTTYTYDALDDLTQVTQGGQSRTFTYDSLARLTSATTPESGATNYTYDTDSTCGVTSKRDLVKRVDARNIRTCFSYDPLHRLASKSYNDGTTPTVTFSYDEASFTLNGTAYTLLNTLGRLSHTVTGSVSSPTTATIHSYDPMGRPWDLWECDPLNCLSSSVWRVNYENGYDRAGDLMQWTHPAGFTVMNTVDQNQRLTAVQANSSGTNVTIANLTWTAFGAVNTLSSPCVGTGCTTPQETYDYNNRLQPVRIQLGTSSNPSADYCLVYNYYAGVGSPSSCTATPTQASTGNNGSMAGYWYNDSVNTSAAHTFAGTYDTLNRLGTAAAKNLSGSTLWSQTFNYDRYGNMNCSGSGACTSMSYNASTNRISLIGSTQTPTYDGAGNLTSDGTGTGTYSYTWDAEGRLATATPSGGTSTTSYVYNALGGRVRLVAPTYTYDYAHDAFGQEIGISNPAIGWAHYQVGIAGRRMYLGNSATRWLFHPNALGSSTMVTTEAGTVVQDATYSPWGQLWQDVDTIGLGNWNFAAFGVIEPTTTLYPTLFRRYSSTQGRWLSPDPLGGDVTNPQSLNRYAYVLNNPTSLIDPLGLDGHGSGPPCGGQGQMTCQDYFAPMTPPGQFNASVGLPSFINIPTTLATPGEAIFNALAGEPGTYLSTDQYGNLGAGFSLDLWRQTHALLDMLGSPRDVDLPGEPLPGQLQLGTGTATFVTMETMGVPTGLIPYLAATSQNLLNIIASMPEDQRRSMQIALGLWGVEGIATTFPSVYAAMMQLQGAWGDFVSAAFAHGSWRFVPPPVPPSLPAPTTPLPPIPAPPLPPPPGP